MLYPCHEYRQLQPNMHAKAMAAALPLAPLEGSMQHAAMKLTKQHMHLTRHAELKPQLASAPSCSQRARF